MRHMTCLHMTKGVHEANARETRTQVIQPQRITYTDRPTCSHPCRLSCLSPTRPPSVAPTPTSSPRIATARCTALTAEDLWTEPCLNGNEGSKKDDVSDIRVKAPTAFTSIDFAISLVSQPPESCTTYSYSVMFLSFHHVLRVDVFF